MTKHWLALAWLGVVLASALIAARGAVDTDLFALLPSGDEVFLTRALRGGEQQVTLLIRAPDQAAALRATDALDAALTATRVIALQKSDPAPLVAALLPYRFQLLSAPDRVLLQQANTQLDKNGVLQARALALIGGPEAIGRLTPVAVDPLGTVERFLRERFALLSRLGSNDERVVVLRARVTGSPFDMNTQAAVVSALDHATLAMHVAEPRAQLLRAGAMFHAAANARIAQVQTALVGGIASAVVLVLAFWLFRQARPLLLVMVPVVIGGVVAFGVAFLIFPRLHVITLVFGATLIGLASDYAFHFLVARDGNDRAMVRRLAPTLFSSAACTALAYSCLALAGMRALTEVAVIGAVGLLAAAVTVVLWFPLFCRGLPVRLQALPGIARWWRKRSENTGIAVVAVLGLASVVVLLSRASIVGDARALDGTPAAVRAETAQVLQAAGGFDAGAFVLLRATHAQALLRAEELVRVRLDRAVGEGALGAYLASSSLVPSLATQVSDFGLLGELWSEGGAADQFVATIGAPQLAAQWRAERPAAPLTGLVPARLGTALSSVWLGVDQGVAASVIRLAGIRDRAAVRRAIGGASPFANGPFANGPFANGPAASVPSAGVSAVTVEWVDVAQRLSAMFKRLAGFAAYALVGAIAAVGVLLAVWQRSARAALGMLPIAVAVLAALAFSSLLNSHLNLFHMFGAFLVVGLGTDSVVVQLHEDDERTALGIIVSQLTTGLDFAALTLVDVPAVRAMGTVVAVGTLLSMLLSIVFRRTYRSSVP